MGKIYVVHGAPCSGKTTYVHEHAGENSVVWDYDSIRQALTLGDSHIAGTKAQNNMANHLRSSFAFFAPYCEADEVWFITTRPDQYILSALGEDVELVYMDVTEEECLKRLEEDDSRPDKETMKKLIHQYFAKEDEEQERSEGLDMRKEIRAFNFEVRAEHDEQHGNILTGRPIVFGQRTDLGWYDEIIEAEALNDTDLRDVRFLVNHNTDMIPLARSRNNNENSTMQMVVGPEGMDIRVDLDVENNADAKSLYSAVSRGDISGMSFMFIVDKDAWEDIDTDHPTRHIRSIKSVMEVSAVTFPAYSQTSISARGLDEALDSARSSLESAKAEKAEIERRKQKIRILMEVS